MAGRLCSPPTQQAHLEFTDLQAALTKLPVHHREVLLLIGAQGMSYEEAAAVTGANVGTVKSRMNRARIRLAELMHVTNTKEIGADQILMAALTHEATHHGGALQAA